MVLKDESNFFIPKRSQIFFLQQKWIAAIQHDGAGSRRLERTQDVKQSALAAPGWTHDGYSVPAVQRERHTGKYRQWASRRWILFGEVRRFEQAGSYIL